MNTDEQAESDKVQHFRNALLELARSNQDTFLESSWRGTRCARVGRVVGVTSEHVILKTGAQNVCWRLDSIVRAELVGGGAQ